MNALYDADVVEWSKQQAELLSRIAAGERINIAELDWPNIADEIESLGKTLGRELGSRVLTILIHLMKLAASPADTPRIGWAETVREQRDEIKALLKDAPSPLQTIPDIIAEKVAAARMRVHAALADDGEQPRFDINSLRFTEDQVLGDWFPDDPTGP